MTKLFTVLLFISFVAWGQSTTTQEKESKTSEIKVDWKTFDQSAYSIQYPSTWELSESKQMGTSFILFSALESEKDQFRENVNLIVQDLTGMNIDLNKYTEISEEQIKTLITNSKLIESKRLSNGNQEYHKIVYTGDQGMFHLYYEQYYWVVNDKAYVLTFTSENDKFETFRDVGERILNSFKVKS